ncbi:hypothetical protein os4_36960 (plasmid) [Comamonadaceae bacterium OS-4]|nr:hypothetical protein os4_36960 [Comamonadaceae bacterium OS-4]
MSASAHASTTGADHSNGDNVIGMVHAQTRQQSPAPSNERQPSQAQIQAYSEIVISEEKDRLKTYIAPGAVIKGTLEVEEGARIAGIVTGDLICANGSAVIEPTGEVKGSVHASERVILMGGRVGTPSSDGKERPKTELVCPGDVVLIGPGVASVVAYYGTLNAYDGGYIDGGAHPYNKR